jgi:DNA-binding CsgD family transcriptional regulator
VSVSPGPWRSGVIRPRPTELTGRSSECAALDRLIEAVGAGESRALVVRGDPGVGKTALLDCLATRAAAAGCRVARAAGVETEMTLAFAGLHQLCAPMLDDLPHLPPPQRDALRIAFGISAGPPPDRFLVGLAVLSLLCDVAGKRPLICVIDDAPWLDQASAQALGFAARRLAADPVGLVFAAREPGDALTGLPELHIQGLPDAEARALLDSALGGPLDARVRDLIVAETQGNPLALLELPRGLTTTELAGGFGLPGALTGAGLPGRIEVSFRRQLDALPAETRRLLLLAAAEPYGELSLVRRAAERLGIGAQAATPAIEAGLVEFEAKVRFRHPLLRSAVYRTASVQDRQEVHRALAEVTDPVTEPDLRAWHRAKAAPGADEEVAAELERSANRAQARGGLAAAAAFLERAVLLSIDPVRRAERTLAAAQANLQAGAFGSALELLATAEAGPLDELQSARVDLLRGEIVFASGLGRDAPPLLLKAASRLEPLDLDLARETYLTAWLAALFAGQLANAGDLLEVSRAARALPPSKTRPDGRPRPVDLVLDGLALMVTDGPAAAAPTLRRVVSAFSGGQASGGQASGGQASGGQASVEDELRWGWLAQAAASALWDHDAWHAMLVRQLRLARDAGALERLPLLLGALGTAVAWSGDFAAAAALVTEADAVCEATGSPAAPFTAMLLAALRGHQAEAASLIEATIAEATAGGQGIAVAYAHWAAAIVANGHGRYEEALAAASAASEDTSTAYVSTWALPELIEAAARAGNTDLARQALDRLAGHTQAGGTDFGLGIQARSRALVSEGRAAEDLYREAIDRLGRTRLRPELARAHLLYGEWLRREHRRVDARVQLRAAHDILDPIGMDAFAERARRELAATGETARRRTPDTLTTLTAQEAHIARLAVDGQTNPEIGAMLFISARTVEWHLRKIFAKLGVGSRRELRQALASVGPVDQVDHVRS